MNTVPRTGASTSLMLPETDKDEIQSGFRRRTSEPMHAGSRTQQENKRNKVTDRIDKELRLRDGAENLYKATNNQKLRHSIALELSMMNSNLQLLKEELTDMQNEGLDINQNQGVMLCIPTVPLNLKETKDVDFEEPIEKFIFDHYHEDGAIYTNELFTLVQMRQSCRDPPRNEEGLSCMFEYLNQLDFIEKRFLPPNHSVPLSFEWYDTMTGIPTSQKSVSFEKGGILFNIAALHTQIGASQDRLEQEDTIIAAENFQKAAGVLKFLHENFSHAPSIDMQPEVLDMLIQLMLSQAQECRYEKLTMDGYEPGMKNQIKMAHEAAKVSDMYKSVSVLMRAEIVRRFIPAPWVSIMEVKHQYYKALAHHNTAVALIDHTDSGDSVKLAEVFKDLHVGRPSKLQALVPVPTSMNENRLIARSHLRQSVMLQEEAIRLHRLSKQPRVIDSFQQILKNSHDRSLERLEQVEDEDDFSEIKTLPCVKGFSSVDVSSLKPDFAKYKVADLFFRLGPLSVFSAKREWSSPKVLTFSKEEGQEFGFSLRGDCPPIVAVVEDGSISQKAGMTKGDLVIAIGERDVKWSKHEEVVRLVRSLGSTFNMTIITPKENPRDSPLKNIGLDQSHISDEHTDTQKPRKKRFSFSFSKKKSLEKPRHINGTCV